MGKKKKKHLSLMKNWPNDRSCTVDYNDLIFPIKKIIQEGYRLERKAINDFTYTGYNIGDDERAICFPTPTERFSARWLENEAKFKRTLLDNALIVAFQLGIEQGRRLTHCQRYNNHLLESICSSRTKRIKHLNCKLSKYEPVYSEDEEVPMISDNDDLIIENFNTESEPTEVDVDA